MDLAEQNTPMYGGLRQPGQAAAEEDPWLEEALYRVMLNLSDGDSVELSSFPDQASADACAKELAATLAGTSEWPCVRGRYLRPETIHSIEVSERRRLTGSRTRAEWGAGQPA